MKIDIKEGKKIFSPENCYLTTFRKYKKTGKNSGSYLYYYDGKMKTLKELSRKCGIKHNTLQIRLRYFNGDIKRAIETPHNYRSPDQVRPDTFRYDISTQEIKDLYEGGMPTEEIQKKLNFQGIYKRLKEAGVTLRQPNRKMKKRK